MATKSLVGFKLLSKRFIIVVPRVSGPNMDALQILKNAC